MKILIIYAIATIVFFAIDMLWLGVIARPFYRERLGFILSPDVNWAAAVIFYLIYIGGILYFAILPALKVNSWEIALLNGAVLGLLCYATYDLTNMATIKNWPLIVVIVDILWGIVLTGSVAIISYLVSQRLFS